MLLIGGTANKFKYVADEPFVNELQNQIQFKIDFKG